ncbi:restriction endonuclease subunit S [Acidovorax sp.]|uniref:restriction endonuclease subunit S n=1 Tax=Acidovorax sp. TaxID=1872122 RepID=UPI00262BB435|nr:restriction endonuclease subunit S [Acidovorax sp.]
MSSEWEISELGKEAINASRAFSFKQHPKVVFVNTGDVLSGKFLHRTLSDSEGLPGQAKKALKKSDILLTEIRPGNGRYAYVDFDTSNYVVSTKFMVIESLGRVRSRFLYHVLTNQAALDELQRIAESRSGTFPQITFDSIAHFPVPVPPDSEQDKLVEFFDSLDDRITLLRETNATLEAIAQALFKSWFVDFDPVRAKMEGRTPEGMDEATAALFPDGFEASELGVVPRGWQPVRLDSFLELAYGKALKAENRKPGPVPVYGSGGVTGWHDTPLIDSRSIIVGRKGTVGSLYWESRPFYPIDTVFYVKAKRPLTYCHQLLKTLGLHDMNTDAAVPGLNRENVYRLLVSDAPAEVLAAFDAYASALRDTINHNEAQAQTLSTLRDTLLPRLISGQLRLAEAQAPTADAMAN